MSEVKTESWQEEDEDFPLSSVFTANQLLMLFMFLLFFGTLALIWKQDATLRFARKKVYAGAERVVRVNADNPGIPDNTISSTKYTPLNFIFKALHICFLQNVNRYFLLIALLQLNAKLTPVNPASTWGPLFLVIFLKILKEAFDDLNLRRSDRVANNREYTVCRAGGRQQVVSSKSLVVGDVVLLRKDMEVPADMVILKTSDELGGCYIQTTNLDGESDLKPRRSLMETQELSEEQVAGFKGVVHCVHPNAAIYSFDANMVMSPGDTKKLSLSAEQMLLQCTHVRNTEWVYGVVVYTGNESKFGCNKSPQPSKMPQVDVFKNKTAFPLIFCTIMTLSIIWGAIGFGWMKNYGVTYAYLGYDLDGDKDDPLYVIVFPIRFVLLISLMIPISLEVNLEFNRTLYAKWMDWDMAMYDTETKSFAHARCSTLAEDLGQIEYVLTDKTGTLTENQMVFKKCSINNIIYGHSLEASDVWEDRNLKKQVEYGNETVLDYFRCLALCHGVMPTKLPEGEVDPRTNGNVAYSSASPDEEALCRAAAFFGICFTDRTTAELQVQMPNAARPERWLLLNVLEFTSDRKRMSVIVKDASSGRIRIYIKGADDRVAERVRPGQDIARCKMHLDTFAESGLRTLLVAVRDVGAEEYAQWAAAFDEANTVVGPEREGRLESVYATIEQGFTLLGATAIEDKLQEGVPDTIALLRRANLRFWMLTGDKYETAIQVGRACRLLSHESSGAVLLTIDGDDKEAVGAKIQELLKDLREERYVDAGGRSNEVAVIITGGPLALALEHHPDAFAELGVQAHCVICCRVTPAQKASVVRLVKERNKMTLAIGDGGNDVAMIQEAHVGVGIAGKEGMQASRASNYCFGKFRFLSRLLLVHGRYSYKRTAAMMQYSFYRSIFIASMQLLFNIFAGFSGVSYFHSMYTAAWAVITVFPALSLSFDKDVSEQAAHLFPNLYTEGQLGQALSRRTFGRWALMGALQSMLVFFLTISAFGTEYMHPRDGAPIDFDSAGMAMYTAALFVQVGVVYVEHNSLHRWNHMFNFFCLALFFLTFASVGVSYTPIFDLQSLYGCFPRMARDPTYWIGTLSIALGAILPHLALCVIKFQTNPEPYQVVQYYERMLSKRRKPHKERSSSQQPLQPSAVAASVSERV